MENCGNMMKNDGQQWKNDGQQWKNDGQQWKNGSLSQLAFGTRRAVHFTEEVKEDSARHRGALQRTTESLKDPKGAMAVACYRHAIGYSCSYGYMAIWL